MASGRVRRNELLKHLHPSAPWQICRAPSCCPGHRWGHFSDVCKAREASLDLPYLDEDQKDCETKVVCSLHSGWATLVLLKQFESVSASATGFFGLGPVLI